MNAEFQALTQALAGAAHDPPANLLEALRALPVVGTLPVPWTTWLLFALMDYRKRQRWGRDFLRKHVPQTVPPSEELRQRLQPVEGIVPGEPEWEVLLECGYGFAELTHRVTGETITVGLAEDDARPIMFVEYLDQYVKPQSRWEAAGRLLELHPDFCTIGCAIAELVAADMVRGVYHDGTPAPPRLHPDAYHFIPPVALHINVARFWHRWQVAENRLWLAAVVGDWLLAHELALASGDEHLIRLTQQRAEEVHAHRLKKARKMLIATKKNEDRWDVAARRVLAEQQAEELPRLIRGGLGGERHELLAALDMAQHDTASWCNEVFEALLRLSSVDCSYDEKEDAVLSCGRYLLARKYRTDDVADMLARVEPTSAEAMLLLLEYAPGKVMPLIRRGLRGAGQFGNAIAVALALIDRPWSRAELLAVLDDDVYHDMEDLLPVVLALDRSHDVEAQHLAEVWLMKYDPEAVEFAKTSFDRLDRRFSELVLPLRDRVPV